MNAKVDHETNDPSIVIEDLNVQNSEAIQGGDGRLQEYYKIVLEDTMVSS
jgi:hypothetical protein